MVSFINLIFSPSLKTIKSWGRSVSASDLSFKITHEVPSVDPSRIHLVLKLRSSIYLPLLSKSPGTGADSLPVCIPLITEYLVNALQFIKDNADFFILFLGKDNLNPISDISSLLPDFNKFVLASMRNSSITEYEKKYLSSFVLHGSVKMISDWISDGCSLSCQKMCSLILNASGRVIGI
jgi:hypothetical protein